MPWIDEGHSHFELIQPRIHLSRSRDIAEADEQIPVYFYAFDLLYLNGFDLTRFPLEQRKAVLQKLIPSNGGWVRYQRSYRGARRGFLQAVSAHSLEGIVAKHRESPYQQTRSRYWLKIKTQHTDHFVIGGFTPPEGSRKYFGALLLGLYNREGDLIHVGRAGGGFDDETLKDALAELKPLVIPKPPFKEIPAEVRKSTWVQPQAGL